ncbi:MAG: PepSY domain-containing protein [Sedimenticola sp.]|nr:PepSY domain-containing protein [Sedimenticola sp.]MCW8946113.1 PepSY domain-containing protein [Sedimenticola sp.]MCW8948543.1 PepSY domain-containing protein [Sedimenticola sp.]MCW8974244.1 PepSY domain-containing protein [Sedimenticola sp.]
MKTGMIVLMMLLLPMQAMADNDHDRARELLEAGKIMALEQILENIRDEYPGRLLEVKLEQEGDSVIYEVELLDSEGKVWELKLDAATGELLKRAQDN